MLRNGYFSGLTHYSTFPYPHIFRQMRFRCKYVNLISVSGDGSPLRPVTAAACSEAVDSALGAMQATNGSRAMLLVLLTAAIVSTRAEELNEPASGVVNDYRFVSHAGEFNYVKLHSYFETGRATGTGKSRVNSMNRSSVRVNQA